jgi:predicted ATPase
VPVPIWQKEVGVLRQLKVSGLKSFGGVEVANLAPITLVFGPNSVGKSTLIQALMLVKQSIENQGSDEPSLVLRGPLVDVGSYPAAIHGHDLTRDLELGLTFQLRGGDFTSMPRRLRHAEGGRSVEFTYGWDAVAGSAGLRRSRVSFQGFDCWFEREAAEDDRQLLPGMAMPRVNYAVRDLESRRQLVDLIATVSKRSPFGGEGSGRLAELAGIVLDRLRADLQTDVVPLFEGRHLLPSRLRAVEGIEPPQADDGGGPQLSSVQSWLRNELGETAVPFANWVETSFEELLGGFTAELHEAMARIAYLGPLRRAPQRFEILSGVHRGHVGREGEHFVEILAQHEPLRKHANAWLEKLGTGYSMHAERLTAEDPSSTMGDVVGLALRDLRSGVKVSPSDVGFGISQLLPIVVQSLLATYSTLCIEQPEIHLHPRLQAELGDLFISASQMRGNQFIIETHSEHLILRLLRRIREGVISSDWIRVVYIEPAEGSGATVRELDIDEHGSFVSEWPSGFFEERLEEVLG